MSLNNNRKYTSSLLTIRNIKFVSHECPDSHFSSHVYSGAYIHWVAISLFIYFFLKCVVVLVQIKCMYDVDSL